MNIWEQVPETWKTYFFHLMTTLHNFALKVETIWAKRVEIKNISDLLFMFGLFILG